MSGAAARVRAAQGTTSTHLTRTTRLGFKGDRTLVSEASPRTRHPRDAHSRHSLRTARAGVPPAGARPRRPARAAGRPRDGLWCRPPRPCVRVHPSSTRPPDVPIARMRSSPMRPWTSGGRCLSAGGTLPKSAREVTRSSPSCRRCTRGSARRWSFAASVGLSDEQKEYFNVAREFSRKELVPFAAEWDEKKIFPEATLRKAAELGFGGASQRARGGFRAC